MIKFIAQSQRVYTLSRLDPRKNVCIDIFVNEEEEKEENDCCNQRIMSTVKVLHILRCKENSSVTK